MAELVYQQVIKDLKKRIFANEFLDMRLPDERSLAESYQVSRSSIKRALAKMANDGIIFSGGRALSSTPSISRMNRSLTTRPLVI